MAGDLQGPRTWDKHGLRTGVPPYSDQPAIYGGDHTATSDAADLLRLHQYPVANLNHRRLLWGGDETRPPQVSLRTAAPFKRSGGNDRAGGPVVEPGRLRYDRQGRRVYLHPGARRDDLPSQ